MDRKELIRNYKETPRPMGVFRVRHVAQGKSLVGTSTDLPGMLNRQRFQLEHGSHPDKELQRDWNESGAAEFQFEILDVLEPSADAETNAAEELRVLKQMWIEKLTERGEQIYPWSQRGA